MKNKMLFLFVAFGCVGITTEIFFTAITNNINAVQAGEAINWRLLGQSYIWMFPIYGLAGLAWPVIYPRISNLNVFFRACIYAIGILAVEFITGWLLDITTGRCPWEYTTGWHIMGYIRLDFFPLWAGFGFMVERIFLLLNRLADGKPQNASSK